MNNILRQILIVISVVGFITTAPAIPIYPSGSLAAILFALASLGFVVNTAYLLYVQNKCEN